MDHAIEIYVREVICFYSIFSVNGVNLYNILDWTDYLDLKEADLTIDM